MKVRFYSLFYHLDTFSVEPYGLESAKTAQRQGQ